MLNTSGFVWYNSVSESSELGLRGVLVQLSTESECLNRMGTNLPNMTPNPVLLSYPGLPIITFTTKIEDF